MAGWSIQPLNTITFPYSYSGVPNFFPGSFTKPYSGFSGNFLQNGLNTTRPQNVIAGWTNPIKYNSTYYWQDPDKAGVWNSSSNLADAPVDIRERGAYQVANTVDPNWQPGFFDNMSNLDLMNFGFGALSAGFGLYNGIQQNHLARAAMRNQEKWAQKNYNAQLGSMLQNRQDTLAARYQGEGRLDADGINAAVNSGVSSLESGLRNGTAGSLGTYNIRDYLGNTDYSGLGSSSTNGMASTATIPAVGTRPEDEKQ